MSGTDTIGEYVRRKKALVDRELLLVLPPTDARPERVHQAMHYAVVGDGKRLRPILTIAVAEIFRTDPGVAVRAGCAIELVHCSSLILDDLPCMDDARQRRGRPTCHLEFGESTATLAAFGLLNRSFQILQELADLGVGLRQVCALTLQLAAAVGSDGLTGGQAIDLISENAVDFATLEFIHSHKTGALFIASAQFGAILGRAGRKDRAAIVQYAKNLGLAFQVQDDLLDAMGTSQRTGKDARKDARKTTFVSLSGIDGARALSRELVESSVASLAPLGARGTLLDELGRFAVNGRT